jgi:hypothetical protein
MDRNLPKKPNPLVAELAADLEPVRPLKLAHGALIILAAAAVSIALVELTEGLWRGMFDSRVSPFYFITNGMLGLLGAASAMAVVRMAKPQVGNSHEGARWSLGMLLLLPVTALIIVASQGTFAEVVSDPYGLDCFVSGSAFGLITAAALTLWLRRGAPVSLNAAGLFTGVAAGAIGALTYGLACPIDHAGHLGIWHVAPVLLSAVAGRFAIPPLVRW